MNDVFSKIYCSECGKWLGVKSKSANTEGIFPYCPRCKKQVVVSESQISNFNKNSAKCRQI